eukprot:scaffold1236_cov58-Phaeocystis_antarctica.AAC.2
MEAPQVAGALIDADWLRGLCARAHPLGAPYGALRAARQGGGVAARGAPQRGHAEEAAVHEALMKI